VIERIVQLAVRYRGMVIGALAVLVLGAALAIRHVKLDAMPDVTTNQVLVLTSAPGYSPDEVERRVTTPVELALAGTPGLLERRSLSRFGISSVTAVFEDSVPAQSARQMVMERLAGVRDALPQGVDEPELGPLTGGVGEIYHFTLRSRGRTGWQLRELAELRVAPLLRKLPGVVEVNSWGGERRAIELVVDSGRLSQHKLTLSDLAATLEREIGTAPGGAIPTGREGQVLLRALSAPLHEADVAALQISTADGHKLRLSELAQVRVRGLPRLGAATRNGQGEVVYLMVQMLRDDNALEVTDRIHAAMPAVRRVLPADVALDLVYDRSVLVKATLSTIATNLLEGGLLVVAVLFALLGSLRAGLIVALIIPLSMLGASIGMAVFGVAGNLMSLGALDFGLLVDGAVVMVEHIFHEQGKHPPGPEVPRATFIARTSSYVARPTLFSVLTILLVYIPVLSLTGVDGKMFRPMALVVAMALGTALVLSLTYVPAAAALWLRPSDVPQKTPLLARLIERLHWPILRRASAYPKLTAACSVAALAVSLWLFARTGTELAPPLDEKDLVLQITRSPDIGLDQAVANNLAMEQRIRTLPEVLQVASRIGNPTVATDIMGIEQADVFVHLKPSDAWRQGLTKDGIIEEIERAVRSVDPHSELSFTQPIQMRFNELLGGAVTDVTASVFGDDIGELRRIGTQIVHVAREVQGAQDVRLLVPPDVPLLDVQPEYAAAAAHDVSARAVLDTVHAARVGLPAATTFDGALPIPIVLRVTGVDAPGDLSNVMISSGSGGLVPLGAVARIAHTLVPSVVQRLDGQRRLMVGLNVRGRDLGSVVAQVQAAVAQRVDVPRGYRVEWAGQVATLAEAQKRLSLVIPAVLCLIVGLMFLVFGKLRYVALVLAHVPFACMGGITVLAARGMPLSISAAIGFIALSGIAVMNAMVLVTELERHEAEGQPPAEAVQNAARDRARPVIMTALVAALGFVPMMLASGVGAEVQRPLATVVVGGIVTSTGTTLVIMPALYAYWRRRVAARRQTHAHSAG
jgi:cobalt-zinc-cadmium resistance protein CzcA